MFRKIVIGVVLLVIGIFAYTTFIKKTVTSGDASVGPSYSSLQTSGQTLLATDRTSMMARVGIGVPDGTIPGAKLEVAGDVKVTGGGARVGIGLESGAASAATLEVAGDVQVTGSKAQVGIGTSSPRESAILEMNSASKGFLPPRLTVADRDTLKTKLGADDQGLTIYNTTGKVLEVWDGSAWRPVQNPNTAMVKGHVYANGFCEGGVAISTLLGQTSHYQCGSSYKVSRTGEKGLYRVRYDAPFPKTPVVLVSARNGFASVFDSNLSGVDIYVWSLALGANASNEALDADFSFIATES